MRLTPHPFFFIIPKIHVQYTGHPTLKNTGPHKSPQIKSSFSNKLFILPLLSSAFTPYQIQ